MNSVVWDLGHYFRRMRGDNYLSLRVDELQGLQQLPLPVDVHRQLWFVDQNGSSSRIDHLDKNKQKLFLSRRERP